MSRKTGFEHKEQIIVDQHFWFTATMLGINGWLISSGDKIAFSTFTLIWITFLNGYAMFLIIHRAAYHADKVAYPEKLTNKPQSERNFRDKLSETLINIKITIKHIPFMIAEFSGSLFYTLLVLTSYIAFLSICKF